MTHRFEDSVTFAARGIRGVLLALWIAGGSLLGVAPLSAEEPAATDGTVAAPLANPEQAAAEPTAAATETSRRRPAASAAIRRDARRARATPPVVSRPLEPPADLADLSAWLDYRVRSRQHALPLEARVFYRHGLLARQSGNFEDAVRLVRGAAELDPTFAAAHWTLCSWFLLREPSQALMHLAALAELAKQSFTFQLELAANGAFLAFDALLWALTAIGFLIVVQRNPEIRHGLQERLTGFLPARAARKWPWAVLIVPYLVGLGFALPTLFFLALLWPAFKTRERVLFVALAGTLLSVPWLETHLERATTPLRENDAPFYGALALHNAPYTPERRGQVEAQVARHGDQPVLLFGLGWLARKGDDLPAAERAYRQAMALWPSSDRVKNNLANVVALQGRTEEALELYAGAIAANPKNAAAYFNLSQIHTRRFDFHAASDALSHASALDFEMVKSHQAHTSVDGVLALEDEWIAPRDLWRALLATPSSAPLSLPPRWRGGIEFAGSSFIIAALLAMVAGLILGAALHRAVPLRRCSNCDRVVCRRCAERRRELALCRSCAAIEARAHQADFARVLLQEHRRNLDRPARLVRTALAALIPGYGLLAFRRVGTPFILLLITAVMVGVLRDAALPFVYEPRLASLNRELPLALMIGPWVLVYAWSLLGYFAEQARHDARATNGLKLHRGRPAKLRYSAAA